MIGTVGAGEVFGVRVRRMNSSPERIARSQSMMARSGFDSLSTPSASAPSGASKTRLMPTRVSMSRRMRRM
jgi:hypothetical protein